MIQNEPKMGEKRQKVSFFSRSIRQYPSTFQESDKTRCTKAPNMLNANILRCYNSKYYTKRDLMNSASWSISSS